MTFRMPGSPVTNPGSPHSPFSLRQLRAVKLGGFANEFLNVLFVERPNMQFRINGRAFTYMRLKLSNLKSS